MDLSRLELERDGAQLFSGLFTSGAIGEIQRIIGKRPPSAGVRIFGHGQLAEWLRNGPLQQVAASILGGKARVVRAILFDKTQASNWALGWHQDRTIAVQKRVEHPGFGRWTVKSGVTHVEPPFSLIERMLTARIHIDPVSVGNAPLLVAGGSHRLGRIEEAEIDAIVERCGTWACLAAGGDTWLYRTAILHASEISRSGESRRVLQVDFSGDDLPGELEWLGVGSRLPTASS